MATYAIADLHGQYDLWSQVKNFLKPDDRLFILGDCGDRGPDGWKIIKEALRDPRVKYIRGNHDQMLLDAWKTEWRDTYIWFCNGGYETFESILADADAEIYLQELNRTLYSYEYRNKNYDTILLSHAGYTIYEYDAQPDINELLWGRDHIFSRCDWWDHTNPSVYVVHGHTGVVSSVFKRRSIDFPTDTKINESNTVCRYADGHKICIDGRSFMSGKIAILDLDTLKEIVFERAE